MVIYSLLQSQKGHRVIISISKSVFVYWKLFPTLFFHNWRSANFFNLETVQVCHIPSVERSEIRFIFLPLASCLSKLVFKNYCKQFFCFISFHFLCICVFSCLCMYLQVYTSTVYFCQNFKLTQENQLNFLEIRWRLLWWEPQKSV